MIFYISYANSDYLMAQKLNRELRLLGAATAFVDRGDGEMLVDPMVDIMQSISSCDHFIFLHSESANTAMLSQIELTYAKNRKKPITVVKMGSGKISTPIKFEVGDARVIGKNSIENVAKEIVKIMGVVE